MKPLHSMPYPANPNQYELNTLTHQNKHTKKQRERYTMAKENKGLWRRKRQPSASKELHSS
jgi:hypothetical protein